eukprot:CAMPEP_0176361194 /NCGR_PEP_ID=MMETSP0126-20121128/17572_1 /TAXON_ID=141414 ORGANISM="Strombidinopsis acuminatum, Strain SPMC142" /NCGR_SAMPLE_ID=MMETSP0126 /ASSEMBLY_ACC=CAM_ASM_000229 /LENGTH=98 /DNA_ID=CAMNT_0017716643 /DNA_START=18 /DNA_END=314 /DNA_ORIENTATION=-
MGSLVATEENEKRGDEAVILHTLKTAADDDFLEDFIKEEKFLEVINKHAKLGIQIPNSPDDLDTEIARIMDDKKTNYMPFVTDMVAYCKTVEYTGESS